MSHDQIRADQHEAKIDPRASRAEVPDDQRTPSKPLRRSTGKERAFRDRGLASNSDGWKAHLRRDSV